jgi:hypothetical protein
MDEIEHLREENRRLKALLASICELCSGPKTRKVENWWEDYECRRAAAEAGCEVLLKHFLVDPEAIQWVLENLEASIKARADLAVKRKAK